MARIFGVGYVLIMLAIFGACLTGWVLNIVKLVQHLGGFGLLEVCRCIGVLVAPLGIVLGFVN